MKLMVAEEEIATKRLPYRNEGYNGQSDQEDKIMSPLALQQFLRKFFQ